MTDLSVEPRAGWRDAIRQLRQRTVDGRLGVLPTVVALVLVGLFFQVQEPSFLSPANLANLLLQVVALGCLTVGVVVVLLIGEIDLSVGAVSGLAAGAMAVANVRLGLDPLLAILLAVAVGMLIGVVQSLLVVAFGAPAFIITVAGSIAWQGLLMLLLSGSSTINLERNLITQISVASLPTVWAWVAGITVCSAYAVVLVVDHARRSRHGLPSGGLVGVVGRILAAVGTFIILVVIYARYDGIPYSVLTFATLVLVVETLLRRTDFGRHVFAIGGNAEAARRVGLNVLRIRITVFAIGGACAALGGVLAASRLGAVNTLSGSGDLMLNAIAAAVIGGTSLFGGRGSAIMAVVGVLVIGTLSNGIDLLGLGTPAKLIITGSVLALAIVFDAVSRRSRSRRGVA